MGPGSYEEESLESVQNEDLLGLSDNLINIIQNNGYIDQDGPKTGRDSQFQQTQTYKTQNLKNNIKDSNQAQVDYIALAQEQNSEGTGVNNFKNRNISAEPSLQFRNRIDSTKLQNYSGEEDGAVYKFGYNQGQLNIPLGKV